MMDSEGLIVDAIRQYIGEKIAPRSEPSRSRWGLEKEVEEGEMDFGFDEEPATIELKIFYLDDVQTASVETMKNYLIQKGVQFIREIRQKASEYILDEKAQQDFCLYGREEYVKLKALYAAAIDTSEDGIIARTYSTQDDSGIINLARYRTHRMSTEPPSPAKTG